MIWYEIESFYSIITSAYHFKILEIDQEIFDHIDCQRFIIDD